MVHAMLMWAKGHVRTAMQFRRRHYEFVHTETRSPVIDSRDEVATELSDLNL